MSSEHPTPGLWLKLKRTFAIVFLGYLAFFLTRFVAGFFYDFEEPESKQVPASVRQDLGSMFKISNYAMSCANNLDALQLEVANEAINLTAEAVSDLEVYTREASVGSFTKEYDKDVAAALALVDKHGADIRLEKTDGVKPYRSFSILIRVPIENFDACVGDLTELADVRSFSVTKEDKSEEVRQRFAERDSLRAYEASLTKLRSSNGNVGDLADLEARIQGIQQQIRGLDVALGGFVKKKSYNNINYSLTEEIPYFVDEVESPLSARIVSALVWTNRWYSIVLAVALVLWLTKFSWRTLNHAA